MIRLVVINGVFVLGGYFKVCDCVCGTYSGVIKPLLCFCVVCFGGVIVCLTNFTSCFENDLALPT